MSGFNGPSRMISRLVVFIMDPFVMRSLPTVGVSRKFRDPPDRYGREGVVDWHSRSRPHLALWGQDRSAANERVGYGRRSDRSKPAYCGASLNLTTQDS